MPSNFETFKSSWMLLTKDETKTFDELTVQLCMFERNFTKTNKDNKTEQEILVAKNTNRSQSNKTIGHIKNMKKDL